MPTNKLWRGTNLGADNGTVGLYRVVGIVSRLPHGGDPDYVTRATLWEAVRAHVSPVGGDELRFRDTSTFISFSESRERAEYYAGQRGRWKLQPCSPYEETAMLFSLDTSVRGALPVNGTYALDYRCDRSRSIPLHDTDEERESLAYWQSQRCEICGGEGRSHSMLLIDVSQFLSGHPQSERVADALVNARQDKEWLVWPTDYEERLKGFSAIVPPSGIWSVEHYRYIEP